jgi:Protein of unknown function (DUF3592)
MNVFFYIVKRLYGGSWAVFIIHGIISGLLLWLCCHVTFVLLQFDAKNWREKNATIVAQKIVKVSDGRDDFDERFAAIYQYEFNDKIYRSDNFSYAGMLSGVTEYVYMNGKSIGDKITISVCPWWPSKSVVSKQWEWWYLWGVILPWVLWFFAGGPWFIVVLYCEGEIGVGFVGEKTE